MSNNKILGIDISKWDDQWNPDNLLTAVKKYNLYFNFIKATDGNSIVDRSFVNNWQMSRDAGLICGAYHFYRPSVNPSVQANFFLAAYKKVNRAGVLPLVIDIEWTKTANSPETWSKLSGSQRINSVKEFLHVVQSQTQAAPIIYTANAFWNEFFDDYTSADDIKYFAQFPLWMVDLKNGKTPIPRPWRNNVPAFIQYHFGENNTTNEPYDKTDQNFYNGSLKDLLNLAIPGYTIAKSLKFSNIVRDIQQALKDKSLLNDDADGFFGNNTFAAVNAFQQSVGLIPNGIVDAQTWNKLLS